MTLELSVHYTILSVSEIAVMDEMCEQEGAKHTALGDSSVPF